MEEVFSEAYKNIIENMTDGVFLVGHDGRVILENSVAVNLLNRELHGERLIRLMTEGDVNDEFYQCIIDAIFQKNKLYDSVPFRRGSEVKYLRIAVFPGTLPPSLRPTRPDERLRAERHRHVCLIPELLFGNLHPHVLRVDLRNEPEAATRAAAGVGDDLEVPQKRPHALLTRERGIEIVVV